MSNFNVPIVDAPELNIPGEEVDVLTHAWYNVRKPIYLIIISTVNFNFKYNS